MYVLEFEATGFERLVRKEVAVSVDRATRVDI
jgi:hypothetical protein